MAQRVLHRVGARAHLEKHPVPVQQLRRKVLDGQVQCWLRPQAHRHRFQRRPQGVHGIAHLHAAQQVHRLVLVAKRKCYPCLRNLAGRIQAKDQPLPRRCHRIQFGAGAQHARLRQIVDQPHRRLRRRCQVLLYLQAGHQLMQQRKAQLR